jgi:hypothetical protein
MLRGDSEALPWAKDATDTQGRQQVDHAISAADSSCQTKAAKTAKPKPPVGGHAPRKADAAKAKPRPAQKDKS